jgi:hypothetical protein
MAWETQSASVPLECRRVLGLITSETHADEVRARVRARLRHYSDDEVSELLEDLENRGLLESEPMAADQDLDFTGNFSFSELFGKKSDDS